jgi:hypothetical protein
MSSPSTALALACVLIAGAGLHQAGSTMPQTVPQPAAAAPAPATATPPDASEVRFAGEILRGQAFERDIGHSLLFRLTPATSEDGGGWVIEILPPMQKPDDPVEFSEIATPPYHAYNERYVAAAFGYSTKEAMDTPLRKFQFVQSVADEHIANEVVNAMLYPSIVPDSEKARIDAEAAGVFLGTGQLHILRSRITPGKGDPDTIAWIKFEVVVNFASNVTLQQVLAPQPPPTRHR